MPLGVVKRENECWKALPRKSLGWTGGRRLEDMKQRKSIEYGEVVRFEEQDQLLPKE